MVPSTRVVNMEWREVDELDFFFFFFVVVVVQPRRFVDTLDMEVSQREKPGGFQDFRPERF